MSTTHKGPGGLASAVHNPAFFTGILTGILLSFVMFGWLFAANRMPGLDRLAFFRNWICLGAFGFVMTIPVLRFFRSPGRIFNSGLVGVGAALRGLRFRKHGFRKPGESLFDGPV